MWLESRFAKQTEEVGLVGFDARLIEGINAGELGGDGAGSLEEENEGAE